jgi:hypothetical protein
LQPNHRPNKPRHLRNYQDALPDDQKQALAKALGRPLDPDQTTSNKVWLIIIWCFGIVMVIAVLVLSISVFAAPVTGGTKPETILTVFMTVTAFLAGLFAPSPVQKMKWCQSLNCELK